jgi:hypothetical protein
MDRVNEIIYSAGLPGVPRMIPRVKFSPRGGVLNPKRAAPFNKYSCPKNSTGIWDTYNKRNRRRLFSDNGYLGIQYKRPSAVHGGRFAGGFTAHNRPVCASGPCGPSTSAMARSFRRAPQLRWGTFPRHCSGTVCRPRRNKSLTK